MCRQMYTFFVCISFKAIITIHFLEMTPKWLMKMLRSAAFSIIFIPWLCSGLKNRYWISWKMFHQGSKLKWITSCSSRGWRCTKREYISKNQIYSFVTYIVKPKHVQWVIPLTKSVTQQHNLTSSGKSFHAFDSFPFLGSADHTVKWEQFLCVYFLEIHHHYPFLRNDSKMGDENAEFSSI